MGAELSTLNMMTAVVAQGIQRQTVVLNQVMGFCEQLKAGQDQILSNQVQMMNAILATKEQADIILQIIKNNDMKAKAKLLSRLACHMKIHLQDPGEDKGRRFNQWLPVFW